MMANKTLQSTSIFLSYINLIKCIKIPKSALKSSQLGMFHLNLQLDVGFTFLFNLNFKLFSYGGNEHNVTNCFTFVQCESVKSIILHPTHHGIEPMVLTHLNNLANTIVHAISLPKHPNPSNIYWTNQESHEP